MSEDFLSKIVEHKKSLLKKKKAFFDEWQPEVRKTQISRYGVFRNAISRPGRVCLIAEVKKASPSRGLIRSDFNARELARIYTDNGADALSVLTEEKYFLGKLSYVKKISDEGSLPVLLKDFIIDPVQIYEAFYYGASAVLLIVSILTDEELGLLLKTAHQFDMDCLLEVHQESELARALATGARIIGINNRDLKTFAVDLAVSERLIGQIPRDRIIVVESGIRTHADILRFGRLGAHAVLIGETFMRAPDVGQKVREVMTGEHS